MIIANVVLAKTPRDQTSGGLHSPRKLLRRWLQRFAPTQECKLLIVEDDQHAAVTLAPEDHDAWLAPDAPADRLKALLRPYSAEAMTAHKISRAVNNARNDSPALIEAVS